MRLVNVSCLAALVVFGVSSVAFADDPDPSTLYDLTVKATPKLKAGSSGSVTVRIAPRKPGEFHPQSPANIALTTSKNITPAKDKLTKKDLKMEGDDATFEVPFSATERGDGNIDLKMSFYICTDKTCALQERTASLAVAVR
jgi:hypothetical protein